MIYIVFEPNKILACYNNKKDAQRYYNGLYKLWSINNWSDEEFYKRFFIEETKLIEGNDYDWELN